MVKILILDQLKKKKKLPPSALWIRLFFTWLPKPGMGWGGMRGEWDGEGPHRQVTFNAEPDLQSLSELPAESLCRLAAF